MSLNPKQRQGSGGLIRYSVSVLLLGLAGGMGFVWAQPPSQPLRPGLCPPGDALARVLEYERASRSIPPSAERRAQVAWLRNHAREVVDAELSRLPRGTRLVFVRSPPGEEAQIQRYSLRAKNGTELGFIEYTIKSPQHLHVAFVSNSTRGTDRLTGLTDPLLAQAVAANPGVTRVSSSLTRSNVQALVRAVEAGLAPLEALKTTPAYRARARLGFVEIEVEPGSITEAFLQNPSQVLPLLREKSLMIDLITRFPER